MPQREPGFLFVFGLPSGLVSGAYSILVTVHDADGDVDQWAWSVTIP